MKRLLLLIHNCSKITISNLMGGLFLPCYVVETGPHCVDQAVLEFPTVTQTHECWELGCFTSSLGSIILECGVHATNHIHNIKQPCTLSIPSIYFHDPT